MSPFPSQGTSRSIQHRPGNMLRVGRTVVAALFSAVGSIAVLAAMAGGRTAADPPARTPSTLPTTTAPDPAGLTVSYDLPTAGRVSLAVYDREGRLVRTLHTGTPHAAGRHAATWDGLDRYGRPLPAGEYTWKLLATAGLRAEFVTQVGQNVDPVWERATGNHEAPVGVAVDATGLYRVGATNEGAHYAVKTDLDGRHLWAGDRWSADPWAQGTVAVTLMNDRLFELLPNGDLYGYDAKTGRVFTGGNHDPKPWNLGWKGYTAPSGTKDEDRRKLRAKECPRDLAADAANGLIVAAYPQHDAVAWYSAKDGKLVDEAAGLAKLAGVGAGADGTVYAITDGAVVALSRQKKEPLVVIPADRLRNPYRLAVDPRSGDVLVAENSGKFPGSAAHHQVKRFDADGRLLNAYGLPEGRGDGPFVATDFRGLTDIEVDPDGGFVVTEGNHTPPRRSARFDVDGRLLREWIGAQHYGVIACPEPSDPRFVWTLANAPKQALVRWEVDYARKSWKVAEVYQDVFAANPYAGVPQVPDVFEHDGRIYIQGGALQPQGLALVEYDPKAKRVRPCVASGTRGKKPYLWCDLNDDGLATDDEVTWLKGHRLGGWVDPATFTLHTTPEPTGYNAGQRFSPVRVTPGGTPVYDEGRFEKAAAWTENGKAYRPGDFRRAGDGSLFGSFADVVSNPNNTHETHGVWYYNSCSAVDRLVKWDAAGRPLWAVGRHSPDADHETGSTAMARGLVGLTHGCVIWGDASDEEAARPTVWTEDGLYVDELLRVPTGPEPKEAYGIYNANEYPCGRLHTDPQTGEVLFFALNSGGGAPIYRITGWDGWHRQQGTVTLNKPATAFARRDGAGLTGEYFNTPDCSGPPAVTRVDPVVYFNWGDQQQGSPAKLITAEEFSVRWTGQYESATNEDVRFEVRGAFPWRPPGEPTWTRLWIGGNLVFDSKPADAAGDTTFDREARSSVGTVRVRLHAGQRVDLRLECGFKKGKAAVALSTDTPGLDRRAIMPEFLHPKPSGETAAVEIVHEPKRPDVIAHFDFETKEGVLEWSRTGGDVFGRLTGGAKRVPGKVGQGVELAARGEFSPAVFPIDEELRLPSADYAVAFWFRTADADARLCEARRYSSYNNVWADHEVEVQAGRLRFRLHKADALASTARVDDGQWHHVVASVGPGGHRLYLDGKLVANGKAERRARTSNRLGLDVGPGDSRATVAFDEVRVLGRVPTDTEVAQLASEGR